jgi:hypothetical protein
MDLVENEIFNKNFTYDFVIKQQSVYVSFEVLATTVFCKLLSG